MATVHLTDAELRRYIAGGLEDAVLMSADDHLAACAECRKRAGAIGHFEAEVAALVVQLETAAGHLTDDDVQAVATGRILADRMAEVQDHLDRCETCASEVRDLEVWMKPHGAVTKPSFAQRYGWWAAAALFVLAIVVPASWLLLRSSPTPGSTSRTPAGIDLLSEAQQARIRAALAGRGEVGSPTLDRLAGARESTMGPTTQPARFAPLEPVGTAVLSDRPTFTWQPLNGAIFEVSVFDERSGVIARSPRTADTSWTPEEPLPTGVVLVWQITATTADGQTSTVPAAPDPPARFLIVDPATASGLGTLEATHPDAHLLIGLAAFDAGLVEPARRHLQMVAASDPGAPMAREALERLERQAAR